MRKTPHAEPCIPSLSQQDFLDDEAITSRHYAEVKAFVESLLPEGSDVVILGHRVSLPIAAPPYMTSLTLAGET